MISRILEGALFPLVYPWMTGIIGFRITILLRPSRMREKDSAASSCLSLDALFLLLFIMRVVSRLLLLRPAERSEFGAVEIF